MTETELVVAKSGSKLKESDLGVGNGIRMNCGVMQGTRTTLSNLAVALSRQLGRPVLDRTGVSERYDFELRFTPEDGCGSIPFDALPKANPSPTVHLFSPQSRSRWDLNWSRSKAQSR